MINCSLFAYDNDYPYNDHDDDPYNDDPYNDDYINLFGSNDYNGFNYYHSNGDHKLNSSHINDTDFGRSRGYFNFDRSDNGTLDGSDSVVHQHSSFTRGRWRSHHNNDTFYYGI